MIIAAETRQPVEEPWSSHPDSFHSLIRKGGESSSRAAQLKPTAVLHSIQLTVNYSVFSLRT